MEQTGWRTLGHALLVSRSGCDLRHSPFRNAVRIFLNIVPERQHVGPAAEFSERLNILPSLHVKYEYARRAKIVTSHQHTLVEFRMHLQVTNTAGELFLRERDVMLNVVFSIEVHIVSRNVSCSNRIHADASLLEIAPTSLPR